MTFENEETDPLTEDRPVKNIPVTELEPLVEKIEVIASVLAQFLLECGEAGFPSQDFCLDLERELSKAPNLGEWFDEPHRNENG